MEKTKTLQITKLGEDLLNYYKKLDCKYFVLNVEDLVSCLNEDELNTFLDILDKFNNYREINGKDIYKYFVLKRNNFPEFNDNALEFINWVEEEYGKRKQI